MFLDDIIAEIELEASQPKAHSPIGASKANEWFNCPASVVLGKGQTSHSGPSATEGTFFHKIGELLLLNRITIPDANGYIDERVTLFDHSFKISEMMMEGVILYYEYIAKRCEDRPHTILGVEQRFCIESVDPEAFGTGDAILNEPYAELEVVDLKTGRRLVSPESKQLKYYALGALEACDTEFDTVKLTIVQPQEYLEENKVKTFTLTRAELFEFKDELRDAISNVRTLEAAKTPDQVTIDDVNMGDWCTFCKGKAVCPAQQETALAVAKNGFDDIEVQEEFAQLPMENLEWLVTNEKRIRSFLDMAVHYATDQAKLGNLVKGFKLAKRNSNRAWIEGAESFLESELGDEAYVVTKKLRSPAQAELAIKTKKGISKPKAKEFLSSYFFNPDKGVVLVEESDKRPAVVLFDDVFDTSLL